MKGYDIPTSGTTHDSVFGAEEIGIQGNILPPQWLRHLRYPSGKPYPIAAIILSDIVYWYRPIVTRDEETGQVLGYRKKFKDEKLQRSYKDLAEMYGFTKREVAAACYYLRDIGLIDIEIKNIHSDTGLAINNVVYLGLNSEAVKELTHNVSYHTPERKTADSESDSLNTPERETNTETTTETSSEILSPAEPIQELPTDNNTSNAAPNTSDAVHTPKEPTVLQAIQDMVTPHKPLKDVLDDLYGFAQRGVTEATGPVPADQWIVYANEFDNVYRRFIERPLRLADRDDIAAYLSKYPTDTPLFFEQLLTECRHNWTGKNGPCPWARILEVREAGGTWQQWKAKNYPQKERTNGRQPSNGATPAATNKDAEAIRAALEKRSRRNRAAQGKNDNSGYAPVR